MTTETLSPTPVFKAFDNNGLPLSGGQLFTYSAGTTTKAQTFTDSTGGTPNTNPIVLNARGEAQIWLPPNIAYKYVLSPATDTDPPTNPIWTVDQINNAQLLTLYGGVDTGSVNAYLLNFSANFTGYTDGIIIYWVPANTNTGASTLNVNNLGVVNILNQDGTTLTSGQIVASGITAVFYRGGSFYITSSTGSIPKSGTFAGTPTGFSSIPPVTVSYTINGSFVSLDIPYFNSTSNATTMTLTGLPAGLQPANRKMTSLGVGMDNGTTVGPTVAQLDPSSGTITLYKSFASFPWTGSGAKGNGFLLGGTFQYGTTMTYSLL